MGRVLENPSKTTPVARQKQVFTYSKTVRSSIEVALWSKYCRSERIWMQKGSHRPALSGPF